MDLNVKSHEQLVLDQAAAMQGRARVRLDFSVGSTLLALVEATAGVGLWLQGLATSILLATRAATSTGADLDSFVGDYGLSRLGAQSAVGSVTFSRFTPGAQAVIPIGARIQTADGQQNFLVALDTSHASYNAGLGGYVVPVGILSVSVPVAAQIPGHGGNATAGSITVLTQSIPYIDTVTNAGAMSGGAEAETDPDLRVRFHRYIKSLSKATVDAILFAVTSLRLGIDATIIEHTDTDGTSHPGFLLITIDDGTGYPDPAVVEAGRAAAFSVRAAGIPIGGFPPIVVTANVSFSLVVAGGYDQNTVIGQVTETVRGHIKGLKLGQSLTLTKLAQLAYGTSPGVTNVTALRINNGTLDLVATPRTKIIPGTIVVT